LAFSSLVARTFYFEPVEKGLEFAANAIESRSFMKRFLPFLIIAIVGVLTIGIATAVYKVKMQPSPAGATAAASPVAGKAMQPAAAAAEKQKDEQGLHVRGPAKAPLLLEIYGDFQCPSCAVASKAIDQLQEEFKNKIKVVFHEFPLSMHQHAVRAAEAAEAAGLQGKFWEMHDALYDYQPVWSHTTDPNFLFDSYAGSMGLDVARFRADRQSSDIEGKVIEDGNAGLLRGVRNTPTIFINGEQAKGAVTKDKLREAIEAALAKQKS
jgi:protein-disulfide isomerase